MANVRVKKETDNLYFDFQYLKIRCREYTNLKDSSLNRKKLGSVIKRIETEISLGTFEYAKYFPQSKMLDKINLKLEELSGKYRKSPTFKQFSEQWLEEFLPSWRVSTAESYQTMINNRLLPFFGEMEASRITKSDILKFRSQTTKFNDGKLKPKTINKYMKLLKMILDEAALRYDFTTPYQGIKLLKEEKVHIQPFSLAEVNQIIQSIRIDWRNYIIVRFFTGMRTSEIDGLKWKYVDFEKRQILIRETFSKGRYEYTKNDTSQREIEMNSIVYEALQTQYKEQAGKYEHVFVSPKGDAINNSNFLNRVWIPVLKKLNLTYRRPYQTRHTCATLWLGAGENPAWIAMQMGHANTDMLFKVYARYVPNLTRSDGSAIDQLLKNNIVNISELPTKKIKTAIEKPNEVIENDGFWDQFVQPEQMPTQIAK